MYNPTYSFDPHFGFARPTLFDPNFGRQWSTIPAMFDPRFGYEPNSSLGIAQEAVRRRIQRFRQWSMIPAMLDPSQRVPEMRPSVPQPSDWVPEMQPASLDITVPRIL